MKVLVAIDGADCTQRVMDFISSMSWSKSDRFMVLSVAEAVSDDSSAAGHLQDACQKLANDAVTELKTLMPDNAVEARVAHGTATEEIIECANFWHADLIVVGSHGQAGCRKFLLGSVAEAIVKKAPCTVQVVRHKDTARRSSVSIH